MAGRPPTFHARPQQVSLGVLAPAPTPARREDVDGDRIYTIRGLLRPRECRALIDAAEGLGFRAAGLAVGDDDYRVNEKARNNERVLIEDRELAAGLWARLSGLLAPRHEGARLRGVNWRLRIYRYGPGQYFRPHRDVRMDMPGGGQSRCSLMIYLNDGFTGGRTRFFGPGAKGKNPVSVVVTPVAGAALVFDHLLLHEGEEVAAGTKYAIRSDVIYG